MRHDFPTPKKIEFKMGSLFTHITGDDIFKKISIVHLVRGKTFDAVKFYKY